MKIKDTPRELPNQTTLYLETLNKQPLLSHQEEIELSQDIHGNDPKKAAKALEKMVLSNLKLAIKIANEYKNLGAELEDLVAEAQIGLHKAAQRFHPEKAKFSTYASWWIKQTIRRYLNKHARTVRLPAHLSERISKLKRIIHTIEQETGHTPSPQDIADITGMSPKSVEKLLSIDKRTISLHTSPEEGQTLEETLHDQDTPTPDTNVQQNQAYQRLNEVLKYLNPREQEILARRFGLNGKKAQTLDDIGIQFGITRERIRQLQNTALKKLKNAYERVDIEKILAKTKKQNEITIVEVPKTNAHKIKPPKNGQSKIKKSITASDKIE
jgi:RNA polymerase primary sigma factor